jgi:hypothetical protein
MSYEARVSAPALAVLLALVFWIGPSGEIQASGWQFIGTRYQGMGGAGVAVVDDSLALYWNPGALGFTKGHDLQVSFGASVSAEGNVMSEIDELSSLARDFSEIRSKISNGEVLTDRERSAVLRLVSTDIPLFKEDDEGFLPRAHASVTGRSGGFAFGVLGTGDAVIAPFFDRVNLGLASGGTAASRIASFVGAGTDRSSELSASGQALADLIAEDFRAFAGTGLEQNQAEEYVYLAESGGLNTGSGEVSKSLRSAAQTTAASSTSPVSNNLTGAGAVTLVTAETTLAYGHSFFDMIGVGGAVRYVYGNTFVDYTTLYDVDSVRELIDETLAFNKRQEGHEFAVDLGILFKPTDWARIGIVGRNLNEPDFKVDLPSQLRRDLNEVGISLNRYKLERQVRAGMAVEPLPWWTIAADIDLTENDNQYLPGFNSRLLSIGTEARFKYRKVALALRGGAFMNLGSSQNKAPTITAGLGLRLWNLTLDVSGGVSTERDHFESIGTDERIPIRVNFAGQLGYRVAF